MVQYRRAIGVAIAIMGVACAALALVDTLDLYDVPDGGIFRVAAWPLTLGAWLFLDVSSRWRTPKVTKTKL
ncbi:hypothetical protein [Nocardioides sp. URHA0020]|uniref:hypothetical protein n=1 Tax=Nocardioides sp. URHA0020 TaxID=1380392 RepID=UPI00048EC5A7|nr:hypothetical protein [Nocardioides sp. URHA0020]